MSSRETTACSVRPSVKSASPSLSHHQCVYFAVSPAGQLARYLGQCFHWWFFLATAMTPFDVIAVRLFNQPVNLATGKGLAYAGIVDCLVKMLHTEGLYGFYTVSFLRLGPHTVLSICLWQLLRKQYFLRMADHDNKCPSCID